MAERPFFRKVFQMTDKLEYIIWGKCPKLTKHDDEVILYTQATSYKHAEYVMDQLQIQHQCTETRIQVLDPTEKPDFSKIICFK